MISPARLSSGERRCPSARGLTRSCKAHRPRNTNRWPRVQQDAPGPGRIAYKRQHRWRWPPRNLTRTAYLTAQKFSPVDTQRAAGRDLLEDFPGQHVVGVAVLPARARIEIQRL